MSQPHRSKPRAGRRRVDGDHGVAVLITALALVPLMLVAAFGIDVASWYSRATELQRAADAAALAGTVWMPEMGKASAAADQSLRKHGFVDGQNGISVSYSPGSTPNSLRVEITDGAANTYLSDIINRHQRITRAAEAEYNIPIPLGSPLNYFGGDRSKAPGSVTYSAVPPSGYATTTPANAACSVRSNGSPSGTWLGQWYTIYGGGFTTALQEYAPSTICQWPAGQTGGIDPNRDPRFWAVIEGPGTVSTQGDAYSPRCYITPNCSSVQNQSYVGDDEDRGYWYVVKAPSNLTGSIDIRVFDPGFNPNGGSGTLAGDRWIDVNGQNFETEFRVYEQMNALDFTAREPIASGSSGSALTSEGNCRWKLDADDTSFLGAWKRLCTISGVSANDIYLVNVRTNGTTGSGLNGYALEACANGSCTTSPQPALYAYGSMAMYNNIVGDTATFYLAEVGPQYAGKTLVMELWDAGDAEGNATIYPMRPSSTAPKPVAGVPAADCSYTSSPHPNVFQNSSAGGGTGNTYDTPRPSDTSGTCGIRSTINGGRQFNATWLRIRINVPSDYTCTVGINPETTANSCWWGIRYDFSSSATDVTTWQARIEGNPVHLTQ